MDYTTLGRTGLKVSVAGLGCGGGSRLGQAQGKSHDHSVALVRQAMDLGVNMLDTASSYGTEEIVGDAIKAVPRDSVVISTKHHAVWGGNSFNTQDILDGLEDSLRKLDTDYVDIFHIHGLSLKTYDRVIDEVVPALLKEKEKGKLRHLAASEYAQVDPGHDMLQRAFEDNCFDVVMLAYSLMNQSAESRVFPKTVELGIGTQIMFAVRSLFSVPGRLQGDVAELIRTGDLDPAKVDATDPLGFLLHEGGAESVIDACYRYVRHQPGADVILFGTGNPDHLGPNLASILKPPLPNADVAKLRELFGHLEDVGLDGPGRGR
jgi:L-galactose dehydrogenase